MDLDTFIISVFYEVDDGLKALLKGCRTRSRGPLPTLADSVVLTMEIVGEFLGMDQDKAIYNCFRQHYAHFFPALKKVYRTTFLHQAANLRVWKEKLWQYFLDKVPYSPGLAIVDGFPVPVCQFARAYRCRLFRGEAAYGYDELARQTFYGFRCHARLCWPGVITRFSCPLQISPRWPWPLNLLWGQGDSSLAIETIGHLNWQRS